MKLKEIREMYPKGTQIVLTEMAGERQMPYGLKGTVKFVDDAGQIHMSWENGSSLALNIYEDTFEKVEAPEKISVILVEPGRYPKLIEIEDTLEAMQSLVEGDIEEYMPFEDEVAIICNDEGKMNGLPLNRAVYSEPENVEMSYPQLKAHFRQAEKKETTRPDILFLRLTALTSLTQRNKEPMLSAVTIRLSLRVWADILSMLLPLTGRINVCDWKRIWLMNTAARTAGRLKNVM